MENPQSATAPKPQKITLKDRLIKIFKLTPEKKKKLVPILSVLLIVFSLFLTLAFFFVFVPGRNLYLSVMKAKEEAMVLKSTLGTKDLDQAKASLSNLKSHTKNIQSSYSKLSYLKIMPIANSYYKDGQELISIANEGIDTGEIVIQSIEPYKDFLGLVGGESASAQETTEDRIAFLTESIEGIIPHLDQIDQKITNINNSLTKIDPSRYPEEFRGINLRSNITKAKETVSEIQNFVKNGKPILTKTSWLLGKDSPRNYLMIFQNDAELRPTGGFWTAYGLMKIDNGKITPLVSDDIYTLDSKLNSRIPAPRPIKEYHIDVPYWNLRDMNLSPDFPTSIQLFLEHYNKITRNQDQIDAVIALDTKVLVDLVRILGQVGVSGFGNFSAEPDDRCDGCPQIIYQLEWLAGRPRNYIETDRKGFLGPMMHSILSNAMGSEKSKIAPLAQAVLDNIHQKHMIFYFLDEETQKAGVLANMAGSITPTNSDTDYLHLNDANMSSAKTNLFLTQKIKHEITTSEGQVKHKVSVTYTNPSPASNCNLEKGDLCLNAPKYRNWFRFYTPKGSVLEKMTGTEVEAVQYEELDKQVFEGFYGDKYPLYAQSSVTTTVSYVSSVPASKDYTLLLQKQPGTKPVDYKLIVNGKENSNFDWVADKTIKLAL
ncbi:MAG: DUF4012 domain-containing protein [Patescibacteria group bacterium]|jgi:hypothetical protein